MRRMLIKYQKSHTYAMMLILLHMTFLLYFSTYVNIILYYILSYQIVSH